jgi:L,D-transpeptidase ErfK/SrfK
MHTFTSTHAKTLFVHALIVAIASAALCGASPPSADPCGTIAGDRWVHLVNGGESWITIGTRVGVDPEVLAARNRRTIHDALVPGDVVGIDNRHIVPEYGGSGLVVNVPQRMLFHYWQGEMRAYYPVAVGAPQSPTALGDFTVVTMDADRAWDTTISRHEDPRGRRSRIGLNLGRLSLREATTPSAVYSYVTDGSIALHPEDAESLFHYMTVGEPVRIVYEPILLAFHGTDVFLEVHRDPYLRAGNMLARALSLVERSGLGNRVDLNRVVRAVREAEGLAVPVTAAR